MNESHWVFIVGVSGSGTTLLNHLMGLHEDIDEILGEGTNYMNNYPQKIREEKGYNLNTHFTDFMEYLDGNDEDPYRLKRLWLNNRKTKNGKHVLVKNCFDMIRSPWVQKNFSPSSFVYLVRNGYSIVGSLVRRGRDLRSAARHWNVANKIMVQDRTKLENVFTLKYEDLTEHPQISMENINEFLNLSKKDYSFLDDYVVPPIDRKYGNAHNTKIININKNPKRKLTKKQINEIYDEAKDMLDYFGYEPPTELYDK